MIREACASERGVEVDTQGDAFFFAFPTAPAALAAASAFTEALAPGPIQVRVGLHTGTPLVTEEGYVGTDVHRAARIAAAGHGGQVLVAASTASLVETDLHDLGEHRFKDLSAAERVFQLGEGSFPPLKTLYRTNLPVPANPLVGRKKELVDVLRLVRDAGRHLHHHLVERRLGPLLELSPGKRLKYGRLLSAWLELGSIRGRAPGVLDKHRQTLRYQVNRIEAMFGDQLADREARVELILALRAVLPEWEAAVASEER